jgi:2-polyprenyl-3-methyl-5-hydroxy-6-metoxy-1,4-benzoquinol methylase
MNQEWLIKDVLKRLDTVPDHPGGDRAYLSLDECFRIVDETIDYLGAQGDETEYTYINGHRKRLANSLSMIPIAEGDNQSCLDVGSYGYMALWAHKYLGYHRVIGIEWHPDVTDEVITRTIKLADESFEFQSHNIDITTHDWAIDESFDTVLFFEVLEHINEDPMGVMERIHHRIKPDGTLVMSVPNAISYKSFKEFLVGMPPWTYWFYQPDLAHEPRHCFEYTPIIFKSIVQAAGFSENTFRTIYAYSEQDHEQSTIEIAQSFGISPSSFGETMIINATRSAETITLRYPDVLYSPDGYYKNIYPHLHDRLDKAISAFKDTKNLSTFNQSQEQINELLATCEDQLRQQELLHQSFDKAESESAELRSKLNQTTDWANTLQQQNAELEAKVNELLFTCDCFLRKEAERESQTKAKLEDSIREVKLAKDNTVVAENLAKENADLRGQVNELLFACDCYLQQINDPGRCAQVIRERQFRRALRVSKSIARKTPVVRTILRPVYRESKKFIKRRI